MKLKFTVIALCLCALSDLTFSQSSTSSSSSSGSTTYGLPKARDFDHWSVGISGGMNWFQGDIQSNSENNTGILKNLTFPVIGLKVGYQLTHSVQVNVRGYYTQFSATKDKEEIRLPNAVSGFKHTYYDIDFTSNVMQGTFNINYTLGNISFLQRNKKFHFFGELGIGMFAFKTKLKADSLLNGPQTTILDQGSSTAEGMIPISLGAKYQVSRLDIGLMFTYHKTLTDKVDHVYKPFSESDNYSFITLNINYTLGKKTNMLEWVNPMEVVYSDLSDMKDKVDVISGDKDKDGVSDMFDKDNSTAEGSKVYGDGTAIDSDGDGIPDSKDSDPFSTKGAKVDANGIEIDSDGDGVPDSKDLEPNTPKGSLVSNSGIALNKPGESGENGMNGAGAGFLPSIFFDTNHSELKPVYRDRMLVIARLMKANPNLKIMISGNCDSDASEQYNDKLGLKRAETCKKHLVKVYDIDPARLSTESKGKKEQVAKNPLKSMNRRVDFTIAK